MNSIFGIFLVQYIIERYDTAVLNILSFYCVFVKFWSIQMDLLQVILVESLKIGKVCIEKIKEIITKNNNLNEFAENTQAKLGFLKYEI